MDTTFSRSSAPRGKDPHGWNSWDHYQTIHHRRLDEYPFIDRTRPDTLFFTEVPGGLRLAGHIYCLKNAVVEVEKYLETKRTGGIRRVRAYLYRYAAWVEGRHPVLRYHNIHTADDDYHHRVFNWRTGKEVLRETLERSQFPTLSEVLDEVEQVVEAFE